MSASTVLTDLDADDAVDLRILLATIAARRTWVIVSIILCSVAFTAAAFLMKPVYRASTVLISASSERNSLSSSLSSTLGQLGGIASLAGINVGSGDPATEEALAVLQSREFTERFIDDLNLMPELYVRKWDLARKAWKGPQEDWPTAAKAVKYFNKKIRTIVQDKKTGLVTLQIDWRDRFEAAKWANELAKRLNFEMRSREIDKAGASLTYLEKELATTSVLDTREAINRLIEAQIKQRMLANVTQEYAFRVVDRAMAPDSDDPESPHKVVLLIAGPLVGLLLGVMGVLSVSLLAGKKAAVTP